MVSRYIRADGLEDYFSEQLERGERLAAGGFTHSDLQVMIVNRRAQLLHELHEIDML
jgi:hypothetical protein